MQSFIKLSLPARHACKPSGIVCRPFRDQRHFFGTIACQPEESTMSQSGSNSLLSTANSNKKKKLRILCLHGYLQNAEVFSGKMGSMRKALKSRAEFIFMDAPHEAKGEEAEIRAAGGTGDHPRTWWHWEDMDSTLRPSKAAKYTGWEASSRCVREVLEKEHPIDGILGFSQGSVAAALFLAEAFRQKRKLSLTFAILISSFMPRDETYAALLDGRKRQIPLETLFIHGLEDQLVPLERGKELMGSFSAAGILVHHGAHFVPTCSGQIKQSVVKFLEDATEQET